MRPRSLLHGGPSALHRGVGIFSGGGCRPLSTAGRKDLPEQAQCVIIGGGVIGSSVAYHLAKDGWKDVVLVEQATLTSGTTWHAAGLVGMLRGTETETRLSMYGSDLYKNLEAETGLSTGFKECGSVSLAQCEERMDLYRRNKSRADSYGVEAQLISAEECGERLAGIIKTDDLVGGMWLPGDGSADPTMVTNSLAKGARLRGVQMFENVRVTGLDTANGCVSGVQTEHGTIRTKYVVNCAGQWARQLGKLAGVNVPLHSAEHFYLTTHAIEGITSDMPVMRDPDTYNYYREWSGGLLVGGFEPGCKPCFTEGAPDDFAFSLLDWDWDQFDPLMQTALERVPALLDTEIHTLINGPESFTPDNVYIMGEAPNLGGFYVAAGMNSSGIASAAGVGKALSQWMTAGNSNIDIWTADIRRFGPFHGNMEFLKKRTVETLGLHYKIPWPGRELESGRPMRRSPLYSALSEKKHARFGNKMGWERPNFFPTDQPELATEPLSYSWGKPVWFEYQRAETQHTRSDASLFDQSSFGKFVVQGKGALAAMQQLCAADVDTAVNQLTYTPMLNQQGGYEADLTVNRTGEVSTSCVLSTDARQRIARSTGIDRTHATACSVFLQDEFFVVSGTATAVRDLHWMRSQIKRLDLAGCGTTVTDVSSNYAVLSLMGPRARDILSRAAPHNDVSDSAFPFGTSQDIGLGLAQCRAARVTYVGELGWELYVPSEFALEVYSKLFQASEELGPSATDGGAVLRDAGYYAIESMRVEKAYRAWGHELTPMVTPAEAGLGFAVAYDKPGGFIGQVTALPNPVHTHMQLRRDLLAECCCVGFVWVWPSRLQRWRQRARRIMSGV